MDVNQQYFAAVPSIDLSLVIGVYSEENIVPELLNRLDEVLRPTGLDYEIIIVDDGSTDRTLEILRKSLGTIPGLRVVELYRNVGQVAAISAGMSIARGAWVLMMDGDLQHDPADIPRFLSLRDSGADVIASFRERREETLRRKVVTALANRANRALLGLPLSDFGSSFRLLRHEIILLLKDQAGYVHYNTADLFARARRFIEIPIVQKRRKSGSSKWTMMMFVMFNLDILVSAMRPVLLAVWGSIAGMAIGIILYALHLMGVTSEVQALTGPVSIILISLLMFMLSVIWREAIRGRQVALGTPAFLIRGVYSETACPSTTSADSL
jgi:glycosyltransferase involved in cell wall biosynthesis